MNTAHTIPLLGAAGFGAMIGWLIYYINRYRKGDVQFSDLTTLVGIVGGGSVLALFETQQGGATKQEMFGAYGIGLFVGFFAYFISLIILVKMSKEVFTSTWFLDGRRKNPKKDENEGYPGDVEPPSQRPMSDRVAILEDRFNRISVLPPAVPATLSAAPTVMDMDGMAEVMDTVNAKASKIIASCDDNWEANKGDCNAFVKAVATDVGVAGLDGDANSITGIITGAGWTQLADGVAAKAAADNGDFVIGGLRGSEQTPAVTHGHVVVVVSGGLDHSKYPTAYWGKLGGTGEKAKTVNYAWKAVDRDKVHYASKTIA